MIALEISSLSSQLKGIEEKFKAERTGGDEVGIWAGDLVGPYVSEVHLISSAVLGFGSGILRSFPLFQVLSKVVRLTIAHRSSLDGNFPEAEGNIEGRLQEEETFSSRSMTKEDLGHS